MSHTFEKQHLSCIELFARCQQFIAARDGKPNRDMQVMRMALLSCETQKDLTTIWDLADALIDKHLDRTLREAEAKWAI